MPPWVGNRLRRIRVPSITSHICAKEGLREEHLAKQERTVASSFCISVAQRPSGSPSAPEKENHTPRYLYLTASVGGTVVIVCSRKTPGQWVLAPCGAPRGTGSLHSTGPCLELGALRSKGGAGGATFPSAAPRELVLPAMRPGAARSSTAPKKSTSLTTKAAVRVNLGSRHRHAGAAPDSCCSPLRQ